MVGTFNDYGVKNIVLRATFIGFPCSKLGCKFENVRLRERDDESISNPGNHCMLYGIFCRGGSVVSNARDTHFVSVSWGLSLACVSNVRNTATSRESFYIMENLNVRSHQRNSPVRRAGARERYKWGLYSINS